MPLRLRIRLARMDDGLSVESIGIANSGFIGMEPESAIPSSIAEQLNVHELESVDDVRILADGSKVSIRKHPTSLKVYVVEEDRIAGPVIASACILPTRHILLNDILLGRLRIVCLDFESGLWCFRDELGFRVRRSH